MSHDTIIRGVPASAGDDYSKGAIELHWKPVHGVTLDEEVEQYRKMLKLYYKALHVADPAGHPDHGE